MKFVGVGVALLWASMAWGQAIAGGAALNAQPQVIQFYSHSQHASQLGMAIEQRVMERSSAVVEHGTKPLWEVAHLSETVPLGDIARELRQQHEADKKAVRVWTN